MRIDPDIAALVASWGQLTLRPLRVTMRANGAVGGQDPLHLDALLSAGLVQIAKSGGQLAASTEHYDLPLPLATLWRHPQTALPLWASTDFAPVGTVLNDITTWHRYAVPPALIERGRNDAPYAPRQGKGPGKNMQVPLALTIADEWSADCVGDAFLVADLLAILGTHVGKKRAQGYGRVVTWQVEEIADFNLLDAAGRLRRPVPIMALDPIPLDTDYVMAGWTPPYWLSLDGGQTACLPAAAAVDVACLPAL